MNKNFFNNFPYTKLRDINLDWILNKVQEMYLKFQEDAGVIDQYRFLDIAVELDNTDRTEPLVIIDDRILADMVIVDAEGLNPDAFFNEELLRMIDTTFEYVFEDGKLTITGLRVDHGSSPVRFLLARGYPKTEQDNENDG